MARSKSNEEPEQQDEEPEQQDEEPERVVDPPEASADSSEGTSEKQWVLVDQSGMLTLPSGATYNLNAGNVLQLSPADAAFIVDQGYGSVTDGPSGE